MKGNTYDAQQCGSAMKVGEHHSRFIPRLDRKPRRRYDVFVVFVAFCFLACSCDPMLR